MLRILSAALLVVGAGPANGQFAAANPEWNRAVKPFRVVGNIYYVGAASVSSYLITTPAGHFLLDAGFRETAPQVVANIEKLGFRLADVRLLLVTHAHYDHAGGIAEIQARTHATLLANPAEAALLRRGDKGDFAWGDKYAFPPIAPDRMLRDGEEVNLGGSVLTAHFTPGHTPGCTSWSTTVQEGGKTLRVVMPCSVSAPGYQLVNNPKYPEIVRDFEATIEKLRALPCDVFLGSHGWDFDLSGKIASRASGAAANPFVDPDAFRRYLDRAQAAIRQAVELQRAERK